MKKLIWMYAAALVGLFAASCSNDLETPTIVTDDDWQAPDGRVVVQLGGSSTTGGAVITRAPYDTDGTTIDNFGIFGLAYNLNGNTFTPANWTLDTNNWWNNANTECLLYNVRGFGTQPVDADKSQGNSFDSSDFKISLFPTNADGTTPKPDAGTVYYYPMEYKYFYSFYAYAPYQNTATAVTPGSDGTMKVTIPIDGSTDVIWGRNCKTVDGAYAQENHPVAQGIMTNRDYTDQTEDVYGFNARYIRKVKLHNELDSDHEDQRNYIPRLVFDHKLTRFNVTVVPSTDQSTDDQNIVSSQIKVKDIQLLNQYSQVQLDVASGILTPEGSAEQAFPLYLCDTNGTPQSDNATISSDDNNTWITPNKENKVNGYFMTIPSSKLQANEVYQLKVTLTVNPDGVAGVPQDQTLYLTLDPQQMVVHKPDGTTVVGFVEGMMYNIKIQIFAIQEVLVYATITGWQESEGDYELPVE